MSQLDIKVKKDNQRTKQYCLSLIADNKLTIIAFIVNLFYFASAYLHLMTATACKTYRNMVESSNPIYDFKSLVSPLTKTLVGVAMIDLILLVLNAVLILFCVKARLLWPKVLGFIFGIGGVVASLGAVISVMVVGSVWNKLNDSPNTFYTLYTSVFVSNISGVQHLFRIQILVGMLAFFSGSVFLCCYWGILIKSQSSGKEKEKQFEETIKMREKPKKFMEKEEDSFSGQQ